MGDTILFDPELARLRRARARAIGFADFLHLRAASEIKERLDEVNRTFRDAVFVTHEGPLWQRELGMEARIVTPAEVLDLGQGRADLVVHAMALHAMDDPVGQMVQARRALAPDGMFIGVCLGEGTLGELREALTTAEAEVRGGIAPRVAPMGDIRSLGGLLGRAGLTLPVADSDRLAVSYEGPLHLLRDLRAMGETNTLAAQERGFMRRAVLARMIEIYLRDHAGDDGRIQATFDLVYLTGWAPHDNQQQPLRPGSAKVRLADALGVSEQSAGDGPGKGPRK